LPPETGIRTQDYVPIDYLLLSMDYADARMIHPKRLISAVEKIRILRK